MQSMKLTDLGEFGVIEQIRQRFANRVPTGWEGIGDDCAVIPWNATQSLLVTTDMLVEKVHFLADRITPSQLGYKALSVNLSDIAAMGGRPVATFLSMGLPKDTEASWCESFFEGFQSLQVPLLGGDTTASPDGIIINVTVLGMADNTHIKRRKDAKPGDCIAVTGPLGDSAAGLKCLLEDIRSSQAQTLVERHYRPRPYLAEGEWLGKQEGTHAMMDLSDGLAGDLKHILKASGLAARIEPDQIPLSDTLRDIAAQEQWNAVELAIRGGEDYILLLTLDPAYATQIQRDYQKRFGTELTVIGQTQAGEPGAIDFGGITVEGFTHF